MFKNSAPSPKREELLPQPTLVKKEQSLMGKKCGKEFGAWNGGIMYALYEAKNSHWNGTCLSKESPDNI